MSKENRTTSYLTPRTSGILHLQLQSEPGTTEITEPFVDKSLKIQDDKTDFGVEELIADTITGTNSDRENYAAIISDPDLKRKLLKIRSHHSEGFFPKDTKSRSFSSTYYSFKTADGQKHQTV